jgi:hypothetical protein
MIETFLDLDQSETKKYRRKDVAPKTNDRFF